METFSRQPGYEDAFGKLIADSTTNELDIASHYPYSPERWRLLVDGTRQFPAYGSVSQYNHATDVHEISPQAGETVTFETNERPRYVVQYEQKVSMSLSLSQALQSGDRLRVGCFDDDNGWFFEQSGNQDMSRVDLVIRRSGQEKKRLSNTELARSTDNFTRLEIQFNWYNVGRAKFTQTYTESNEQVNQEIASISINDGGRGPEVANLPVRFEVVAGSSTSNLTLNAGSVSVVTLGDVDALSRVKSADFQESVGSTGVWEPIRAFRLRPENDIVNVQLASLKALNYSADDSIRLLGQAFSVDNVTFGTDGWSTPAVWNSQNNALETRTDVTGVPNQSGSVNATVSDPGGYQIGRSTVIPVTGDYTEGKASSGNQTQKQGIPTGDYLVILAKSGTVGDVDYELTFEQDW
jgi:hypothetical protein